MVSTLNINGQVVGTAIFDGEKITATVTIGSPITATVNFGGGGVTVHNDLTGRSDADAHPIEAITGLTESLGAIPTELSELTEDATHRTVTDAEIAEWNGKQAALGFTPEDVSNKKTTLTDNDTDYLTSKVVTTELGKKQDIIKFTPEAEPGSFASWVRGVLLTGLGAFTNFAILAEDTLIVALGKLQGQINSLAARVGKLEDNVFVDITITTPVTSVDITTDKHGSDLNIPEGSGFEIVLKIPSWYNAGGGITNRLNLIFNNNGSSIYNIGTTKHFTYIYTNGGSYLSQFTNILCNFLGGEIQGFEVGEFDASSSSVAQTIYAFNTDGLNANSITSINLIINVANSLIPIGSKIMIRKK
jgi:hypothetical protein